ncbi:hypothetical protein B0T36_25650 [Nocardia donostiensis]|uniref:hypothetical protein n=1 Tax=Nocardia donostiensis TaxID=1538463 RepID=UPI0009DA32B2|nr:hypothetical protein [Nocardia donostiensis]OQS12337.1 hypothetical protein B0T36_25650 [Nocardia donostiensis]
MNHSIALGWIDYDISRAPESDRDRIRRLAGQLGYQLVWPDERSVLRVVDQVRNAGAELVILPAPDHLGPLELNAVMDIADVETVLPRLSFPRWTSGQVTP